MYEQRNLPARGFRPAVMLGVVVGVCAFGFYKIGKGIREQKYVFPCISLHNIIPVHHLKPCRGQTC